MSGFMRRRGLMRLEHLERARELEDRVAEAVDASRRHSNMDENDQLAISIVCGEAKPTEEHSREWAYKRVRMIAKHRTMGLITRKIMECADITEVMGLVPYLAPKPEQEVLLTGDKDKPLSLDVTQRVMTPAEFFGEILTQVEDRTRGLPAPDEDLSLFATGDYHDPKEE